MCGTETCRYGTAGWDYADVSGQPEICGDGYDNNCDGLTDDEDPTCCFCSPGDYCCTDGCNFDAAGTTCNTTDACNGNQLCDYKTCDGSGQCVNFAGCSACLAGTPVNECGEQDGNCLKQAGDDICDATSDETLCCNLYPQPGCWDLGCDASFNCYGLQSSGCTYNYTRCLEQANNPQPGELPDQASDCEIAKHAWWDNCA
jgi:hypothetical protein